jgi:type II secretory ATPase GspE/PulE/Tfp pilus assembly ATPase PilB-like protein
VADTQNDQVLKEQAVTEQAATKLGLSLADGAATPAADALSLVPEAVAREYRVLPVSLENQTLTLVLGDPSLLAKPAPAFLQDLKKQRGLSLKLTLATPTVFTALLAKAYPAPAPSAAPSAAVAPDGAGPVASAEQPTPSAAAAVPAVKPVPVAPATPPAPPVSPQTPAPAPLVSAKTDTTTTSTSQQATPIAPGPAVPASVHSSDVPTIDLKGRTILRAHLERFPEDVALKYQLVVFELSADEREASVAAVNPDDPRVREILKFVQERNGVRIRLYRTDAKSFAAAVAQYRTGADAPRQAAVPVEPPLQRATADTIRTVAQQKTPTAPSAAPKPPSAPAVPVEPPAPQPVPAAEAKEKPAALPPVPRTEYANPAPQPVRASDVAPAPVPVEDDRNLDQMLGGPVTDIASLEAAVQTNMVPRILAVIVSYAVQSRASDIHLEPSEQSLRIRFRVDGALQEIAKLPAQLIPPLVSRVKILSRLKIDETRLPQDGRFQVQTSGRQIDLRVSTLPTVFGEKVVLRLLDKAEGLKRLEDLGLIGTSLAKVQDAIASSYGIILVTGPTGSGKTTTLYAMLSALNTPEVNIVTLEDPVEYQIEGISQTQVKPKIGYGFADGLRSILRQDPNVIMVGEIRDRETAALATQAALTGHLVLATLHTNDAAGAIPRLIDMGVEPFLLASSLKAVIAQRLVRRLVPEKRTQLTVPADTLERVKAALATGKAPEVQAAFAGELTFFDGANDSAAYHGRTGIYEVLTVTDTLTPYILKKTPGAELAQAAEQEGMVTLRQAGILKALAGEASLGDVLQGTEA